VVIQFGIPHPAVLEGAMCRVWQTLLFSLVGIMLYTVGHANPSKDILPQVKDFTMVPRESKFH